MDSKSGYSAISAKVCFAIDVRNLLFDLENEL